MNLLYRISNETMSRSEIVEQLRAFPEIRFVSLVGVDLAGNDTDEKIPIRLFLENPDSFHDGTAVQTDGSSVVFKNIATINNAKVDMVADSSVNWYVDYNDENVDEETGKPVGTLRIPAFLVHNTRRIDSRSILADTLDRLKTGLLRQIAMHPSRFPGIEPSDPVIDIVFTSGTELEFWVKTPAEIAQVEELSASQVMQENYWQRTRGQPRTALEQTLYMLERYGLKPEMGHKEVGGVKATIGDHGVLSHVLEQMEIDWHYSPALQAADNELLVRMIVKEVFRHNGLDVIFKAKPIQGVAGNGKHLHIGMVALTKSGRKLNLFAPENMSEQFLSVAGYGALMGLLKHYEIINPIISATTDSLNRLQPGYEAPVCIVTSLGISASIPSRNRTVLVGLVRELGKPASLRFEVRSPNPFTNTYLALAVIYAAMADGIDAAIGTEFSPQDLERIISKSPAEEVFYLETDRMYRSEEDVFEHYTEEERNRRFGTPPITVFDNMSSFIKYPEKVAALYRYSAFTPDLIASFSESALLRWKTEIGTRIIPDYVRIIRLCKEISDGMATTDMDVGLWEEIRHLRLYLVKDSMAVRSLITRVRDSIAAGNLSLVSELFIEMQTKVERLNTLYSQYRRNMMCLG